MTKGKTNNNRFDPKWLLELIKRLPLSKLTRSQTVNVLSEAFAVLGLLALSIKLEGWMCLVAFFVIMGFAMWCHSVSRPRNEKSTRRL